jgi:hypothetical protein
VVLRGGGLAPSPGEVVLGMDEKPNLQALRRLAPAPGMEPGRIERRECEYERKGSVHFLVASNVSDGTMLGWGLDKNDPIHIKPIFPQSQRGAVETYWDSSSVC